MPTIVYRQVVVNERVEMVAVDVGGREEGKDEERKGAETGPPSRKGKRRG